MVYWLECQQDVELASSYIGAMAIHNHIKFSRLRFCHGYNFTEFLIDVVTGLGVCAFYTLWALVSINKIGMKFCNAFFVLSCQYCCKKYS